MYLNTQHFATEEQQQPLAMLEEQWGIRGSLNRDKQYFRIRITVESTRRLRSLLEPDMRPEFMYKFPQVTP